MSASQADMYARRAKNASDQDDINENLVKAVRALVDEVKSLQSQISILKRRA